MSQLDMSSRDNCGVVAEWLEGSQEAEWELLARAGRGDGECQGALANGYFSLAMNDRDLTEGALGAAEMFARLLTSHGRPADRDRLAAILSVIAAHYRSTARQALALEVEIECLLILNGLADEGNDQAAQAMSIFAEEFSVEAVTAAATRRSGSRFTRCRSGVRSRWPICSGRSRFRCGPKSGPEAPPRTFFWT